MNMRVANLWKMQQGDLFFLATKSSTGKWTEHPIKRGDWGKIDELINGSKDKDVYMCPHGFKAMGPKPRRLKTSSIDPKLLYADLDKADPSKIPIRPTIAIESSPGRYVGYWFTDQPASEELNRRLAYMIGADISGWDRTQVLRVPGTRNHKYKSKPRVRVLWEDGPVYKLEKLDRMIPQLEDSRKAETSDDKAMEIYTKYESKMTRWTRKELLNGNPKTGSRSEVLWKLQNELIEIGVSTEELFHLLWASPWNKFRDRFNGEDQLRREIDKTLSRHLGKSAPGKKGDDKPPPERWDPLPLSIAEVERENIEWVVPGLLARKEMTIVEGDPGLGKSYFVQVVSGLICDGKPIPCLDHYHPTQGRVAYFDIENTASTVTRARLEENGVINLNNYFQGEEPFSVDDEERWSTVLDRLMELKPELVVFDTINTYIGGTDTYRSSETQQAMGFFKEIAIKCNCSVVILRHLTKGGNSKALYRGQGSIAFTGAVRIVATVGRIPDDPDVRVVACTKNNISAPFRSFTYTIEGLPSKGKNTNRSRLVWGEQVDLSADEIIEAPKGDAKSKSSSAIDWLKQTLEEEGRIEVKKLTRMAEGRSITRTTLYRSAEKLEVKKEHVGFGKTKEVWWSL